MISKNLLFHKIATRKFTFNSKIPIRNEVFGKIVFKTKKFELKKSSAFIAEKFFVPFFLF